MTSYEPFVIVTGLLADLSSDEYPTLLWGVRGEDGDLRLAAAGTHFVYCHQGELRLQRTGRPDAVLEAGMYAAVPGRVDVLPEQLAAKGIVITALNHRGMYATGGPVEPWGRLPYIDGCTDTLLLSPPLVGDPCFNALFFPAGTDQTAHTHPSNRVGMVIRGSGECETPEGIIPLFEGQVFIIHTDGLHKFRTKSSESMTVVAYHPDSDFGPGADDHPMINRTIVGGLSANKLTSIRTAQVAA